MDPSLIVGYIVAKFLGRAKIFGDQKLDEVLDALIGRVWQEIGGDTIIERIREDPGNESAQQELQERIDSFAKVDSGFKASLGSFQRELERWPNLIPRRQLPVDRGGSCGARNSRGKQCGDVGWTKGLCYRHYNLARVGRVVWHYTGEAIEIDAPEEEVCVARSRGGRRCGNPVDDDRTRLCLNHYRNLYKGLTVIHDDTGQPIQRPIDWERPPGVEGLS